MTLVRFTCNALPATPWKNGGGSTREIVSWPPGAGIDAFDWRVSVATIIANGPFSVFPGVDRTIVLLDGDGVVLHGGGLRHRLNRPFEPFVFPGDDAVECSLIGGESTDLNVMARRDRGQAEVQLIEEATTLERMPYGLLLTVDGLWRVGGGSLGQGQGVWWADQPEQWRLVPASRGGKLLSVCWWPERAPEF